VAPLTPVKAAGEASCASVDVLLVDAHIPLRATLEAVLAAEAGIAVVAAVGTFDEAFAALHSRRPHVALVDVGALGHRGLEGLADLLAARPLTAILAMGVIDDPAFDRAAVRHGAVGWVLKDTAAPELAAAVRMAARRTKRLTLVPPAS
jgi:two-component system, NarL family, response regulator NreC